eukprot:m.72826 g.72826  ORF g.72826 m.72826 type:complete len:227 (-) comp14285_c0_seq1:64-744(-)
MSAKRAKSTTQASPAKKAKGGAAATAVSASALWKSSKQSDWAGALGQYNERIQSRYNGFSKGRQKVPLPTHDQWLWNKLPAEVKAQDGCLSHGQLAKIMEWKLSRGKSRPLLKRLKENNSAASVKDVTKRAFALAEQDDTLEALKVLCELRYVGPATASAIMAPLYPSQVAFMSDELMAIVPGIAPDQYTMASLTTLLEEVAGRQSQAPLQDWSLADIEKALWSVS